MFETCWVMVVVVVLTAFLVYFVSLIGLEFDDVLTFTRA